jgi:hypothetical protein
VNFLWAAFSPANTVFIHIRGVKYRDNIICGAEADTSAMPSMFLLGYCQFFIQSLEIVDIK